MRGGAASVAALVVLAIAGLCASIALADAPNGLAVTDAFTRADGAIGTGWTVSSGSTAPSIVSNTVTSGTNAVNAAYYTGASAIADEAVEIKVSTLDTSHLNGVFIRYDGTSGYAFLFTGTGTYRVYSVTAGTTLTQLQSVAGDSIVAGDCLGVTAVGNIVTTWRQAGCTGTWATESVLRDSTYTTGRGGIYSGSNVVRLDDFRVAADPESSVSTQTVYTTPATLTVTGGGTGTVAMGSNCGGTTTDGGGATVTQPACSVLLTGDSQAALIDVRKVTAYTVGVLGALLFSFAFWRTFGKHEAG